MMNGQPSFLRIPTAIALGLATTVLASGGIAAWVTLSQRPADVPAAIEAVPANPSLSDATAPTAPANVPGEQSTTVYWLQDAEQQFQLTAQPITVNAADQPEAILTTTLTALLAGPSSTTATTTIPAETELLGVDIAADGIHVDVSDAFTTGGGSASMVGRLGQVLYTATVLDADAPVWISVQGEPLTLLGGEGIVVSQPMTRSQFADQFAL